MQSKQYNNGPNNPVVHMKLRSDILLSTRSIYHMILPGLETSGKLRFAPNQESVQRRHYGKGMLFERLHSIHNSLCIVQPLPGEHCIGIGSSF